MQNDEQSYQLLPLPLQLFMSTVPRRGGGDAVSVSRNGGRSARDTSTHVLKTKSVGQRWWCLNDGQSYQLVPPPLLVLLLLVLPPIVELFETEGRIVRVCRKVGVGHE
jgi:hypothetical protein